jgi:hypothetical protein
VEQYEWEGVVIPAGSAHQVRNLRACIKVALDFVSPESVGECMKLREEFRRLAVADLEAEAARRAAAAAEAPAEVAAQVDVPVLPRGRARGRGRGRRPPPPPPPAPAGGGGLGALLSGAEDIDKRHFQDKLQVPNMVLAGFVRALDALGM